MSYDDSRTVYGRRTLSVPYKSSSRFMSYNTQYTDGKENKKIFRPLVHTWVCVCILESLSFSFLDFQIIANGGPDSTRSHLPPVGQCQMGNHGKQKTWHTDIMFLSLFLFFLFPIYSHLHHFTLSDS